MNIILKLTPNMFCLSCRARGYVAVKTGLCLHCTDTVLRIAERQVKLVTSTPLTFLPPKLLLKIKSQLEEFANV